MDADRADSRSWPLLSVILLLLAGFCAIAWVYAHTIEQPSVLKWNTWAFHEWLINYEGGFVRRGLAGHLIRAGSSGSEFELVNWIVFLQFAVLVTVSIAFAVIFVVGLRSTLFFVLCPLSFLGMAIGNHHYYRKEVIFYIGILLVAVLVALFRRSGSGWLRGAAFGCIGLWSTIGPFIHEGFVFFCVPIFSLILADLVSARLRVAVVSSYLIASFVLCGIMAYFSGNADVAKQIWLSLSEQARSLVTGASPDGGVGAIGWSAWYAISLTARSLLRGMATYFLLPVLVVYFVVAIVVSAQRDLALADVAVSQWFISGFTLILLSFSPLFVVAWDWGRVICGVYNVSLAFFSLRLDEGVSAKATPWLVVAARPALLTVVGLAVLLLTKVPECCIGALDGNGNLWRVLEQLGLVAR